MRNCRFCFFFSFAFEYFVILIQILISFCLCVPIFLCVPSQMDTGISSHSLCMQHFFYANEMKKKLKNEETGRTIWNHFSLFLFPFFLFAFSTSFVSFLYQFEIRLGFVKKRKIILNFDPISFEENDDFFILFCVCVHRSRTNRIVAFQYFSVFLCVSVFFLCYSVILMTECDL